jgi:hypothetical protein
MFRPPDVPLPSPTFSHADLLNRLQYTPEPSPIGSPLRTSPIRLVDALVAEEKIYLAEMRVLQALLGEAALEEAMGSLRVPVDQIIALSEHLLQSLSQQATYFSTPQKDSLLQFSKVVLPGYHSYCERFKLGVFADLDAAGQDTVSKHIKDLPVSATVSSQHDKQLDWLLRRPLSRVKAYCSVFKKLLHSSDDATELFLAHDVFHGLLNEARETLQQARQRVEEAALWLAQESVQPRTMTPLVLNRQPASRSVSGESTSTQSSTNSHISNTDILRSLQDGIDASQAKDIFSLAPKQCVLDLLPRENEARSLVCRDTFQLSMRHSSIDEVMDHLVEVILLTDLLLIVRPTFTRPQLLFPPLLRGVFQVSSIPTESRVLELDIIGRETLRLTATTPEAKRHWYDLLLACENYELDLVAPPTLAPHVGGRTEQIYTAAGPRRYLPPTPPHTATVPSFGTQPLRVIRENSQLSIAAYSDPGHRTPDAHDQTPFHFDHEEHALQEDDERTPRAANFPPVALDKPLPRLGDVLDEDGETVLPSLASVTFPAPPTRAPDAPLTPLQPIPTPDPNSTIKKSKTINLFSADSITNQFLSMPQRRPPEIPAPTPPSKSPPLAAHLDDLDLDFTKDQTFDESLIDLPQLPALSFGDGGQRPSSVALQFSPATLSTFGIPPRVVPQPSPMQLPETSPAKAQSKASPQKSTVKNEAEVGATIAERRLGAGAELTLSPKPSKNLPPAPPRSPTTELTSSLSGVQEPTRDLPQVREEMHELYKTMAECYNWVKGTWTPILMDNVDAEGKIRAVRSCRVTVLSDRDQCGFLEVLDLKQQTPINTFSIFGGTSLMRDDSCDISIGLDVGQDKVYLMFRCENPDKANLLQRHIEEARRASPTTGFVSPPLPVTPLWPIDAPAQATAITVDNLKIKLYHFQDGKWINKGSTRLTVAALAGTAATRVTLTGKTKKGDRVCLVNTVVSGSEQAEAISKTGISLQTDRDRFMLQFKSDKERHKILRCIVV